ncbi:MAG: trypsin-like peptidase domain-containing protein [Sandaracinus sp.]
MTLSLSDLSDGLASLVERAGPSVLGIGGTTGIAWTSELAITSASSLRCHGGASVEVRTATGQTREGTLLGLDPASDLAVVRVADGGLTPIARRDASKPARVGEVVLALGRPGRAIRASQRIVGLVGKDVRARRGLVLRDYVEMDRGFPDGFVGGPVVDAEGALVGLGTDRVIRGADLAMSPAELAPIVEQIAQSGAPRLGWLGVAVQPAKLPERLAAEVPALRGALVTAVEKGGPADLAGIVLGDVVVGLDERTIEGPDALLALLRGLAGVTVTLRLVRAGAVTSVPATVGTRKA